MMTESGVGLHLLAPVHAFRIVIALPIAIGIGPASADAVWVALASHGVALRRALHARARGNPEEQAESQPRHDDPYRPGLVTLGRFLRQRSSAGSRSLAEGGSLGRPITGAPSRDQSRPLSLTLNQTKSARPRMFSNGTPPP